MAKRPAPMPAFSTLLPADVRLALIEAAKVREPRARLLAVQAATERAQMRYPSLFKIQPEGVTA